MDDLLAQLIDAVEADESTQPTHDALEAIWGLEPGMSHAPKFRHFERSTTQLCDSIDSLMGTFRTRRSPAGRTRRTA
jgi:hypothetical protein